MSIFKQEVERALSRVKCPNHGTIIKVTWSNSTQPIPSEPCCETFSRLADNAIKKALDEVMEKELKKALSGNLNVKFRK